MNLLAVFLVATPALSLWSSKIPTTKNFCAEELCDIGSTHIGCNNTGKFSVECPSNAKMVPFTKELKELSLQLHNKYRSEIALGLTEGYKMAARMAELVWNDHLAHIAEFNTKTCIFQHDECRNTMHFLYVGQNIGQVSSRKKHIDSKKVIEKVIEGWYKEYLDADMSYIKSFRHAPGGIKIGHFTQLVRDEAFAVGCALSQFERDKKFTSIYTCDYSLSNIDDYPIYRTSKKPASDCKSKISKDFSGLCSIYEIYDNSLFYEPWN